MSTYRELDATDLARAVRTGERSARSNVEAAFEAIDAQDGALDAFGVLDRDGALTRAIELDRRREAGEELGPLAGVPVALKSNMCLEGVETHCGSKILAGYRPPYTATFVAVEAMKLGRHQLVGATGNPDISRLDDDEVRARGLGASHRVQ